MKRGGGGLLSLAGVDWGQCISTSHTIEALQTILGVAALGEGNRADFGVRHRGLMGRAMPWRAMTDGEARAQKWCGGPQTSREVLEDVRTASWTTKRYVSALSQPQRVQVLGRRSRM